MSVGLSPAMLRRVACALVVASVARDACAKELDRCEACAVTYFGLTEVLRLEHMDEDKTDILAGGRLDSKGVRQGEVIKYATSEFRTSHLIDQVCDVVATFQPRFGSWVQNASLAKRFEEILQGKTNKPLPKVTNVNSESEQLRLSLRNYCDNLVEDHEDDLAALIKADGVDDAGRDTVCTTLARSCKTRAAIDKAQSSMDKAKAKAAEKDAAKVDLAAAAAADAPKKKRKRKKAKKEL